MLELQAPFRAEMADRRIKWIVRLELAIACPILELFRFFLRIYEEGLTS